MKIFNIFNKKDMNDQIIADFAKAWQTLDASLIIRHLAANFIYDSQWVFESLDHDGYVEYIKGKFATLKRNMTGPQVSIVDDPHSAIGKMLRLDQNGNTCFYRIKVENGKVVKGDLCMF